jgi:hypothetical protein
MNYVAIKTVCVISGMLGSLGLAAGSCHIFNNRSAHIESVHTAVSDNETEGDALHERK